MERANKSRTIVITTETPEPGSGGPEAGGSCVQRPAGVKAGPSSADTPRALDTPGDGQGEEHEHFGCEDIALGEDDGDEAQWETNTRRSINQHNWTTAAQADILDVRCKTVTGQLHKTRLGSGGRGRCILRQGKWLTPTEFEALSGRAQSKDWKRSIRFGGKSLQAVIDAGLLLPHAANCMCANCSDDPSVAAPVKLFTPYRKRKFRQAAGQSPASPPPVEAGPDGGSEQNCLPSSPEESELSAEISSLPSDLMWTRLEEMSRSLLRQALTLTQVVRACREKSSGGVTRGDAEPGDGERTGPPEPPDPSPVRPVNSALKCANCNRTPLLECGHCRGVTYCSRFCCRKDWPSHRTGCARASPTTSVMFILADGSDRLITVSQTE